MCQDTGTAIINAKKGQRVWTGGGDEEALSRGVFNAYTKNYFRYSQNAALTMYDEKNTGTNLPAQIDITAVDGDEYGFLFIAKGGGSANKTYLFQETKAVLNPDALQKFLIGKMKAIGTAACPPYHLAVVVGGTSAELVLKTVKLASARYLDGLPTTGRARAATLSATSSSRPGCSRPPVRSASGPGSAASTSASTSGSSACPATAPPARSGWASAATPTGTSRPRSPATASSSNSLEKDPARYLPGAGGRPRSARGPGSTSTGR